MANYVFGVNPEILRWARERSGYSIDQIAIEFNKSPDLIELWEKGDEVPTYNQLEKLAYSFYKRPIALFFFPSPPEEEEPRRSFRTLPDSEISELMPDTLNAIRQAFVYQLNLMELNEEHNPSEKQIFRDIRIHSTDDPIEVINQVREYLQLSLDNQIQWRNLDIALDNWRNAIQDAGVFIFKRSFRQLNIFGFSLYHDEFPIIILNNSSSRSRQIFTLFHELAHILLRTNSITLQNDKYINLLKGDSRAIELFCNKFTAEFLVPSTDFDRFIPIRSDLQLFLGEMANRYKVSREVILRKLLDRKIINNRIYDEIATQLNEEYLESRKHRKPGGDYYATQATYFGDKYLSLLFKHYYKGSFPVEQLAEYLNMNVNNIPQLEQFLVGKA